MTKKEYILQYIAIGVSFLAVIASVFAGWMAYKASISSAQISGKMNKENELETRNQNRKYDIYMKLEDTLNAVNGIDQPGGFDGFTETWNNLNKVEEIKGAINIFGSKEINSRLDCLDFMSKLSPSLFESDAKILNERDKDENLLGIYELSAFESWYEDRIYPQIYFIRQQIRTELTGDSTLEYEPRFFTIGKECESLDDQFCEDNIIKKRLKLAHKCNKE